MYFVIAIFVFSFLFTAYIMWSSPLVSENEEGKLVIVERERNLFDLYKTILCFFTGHKWKVYWVYYNGKVFCKCQKCNKTKEDYAWEF